MWALLGCVLLVVYLGVQPGAHHTGTCVPAVYTPPLWVRAGRSRGRTWAPACPCRILLLLKRSGGGSVSCGRWRRQAWWWAVVWRCLFMSCSTCRLSGRLSTAATARLVRPTSAASRDSEWWSDLWLGSRVACHIPPFPLWSRWLYCSCRTGHALCPGVADANSPTKPIPECHSQAAKASATSVVFRRLSRHRNAMQAELRRSGLAARQQMHNSMAFVRMPRSSRRSGLTQAASPIPSAAHQHSLLCRVAAEKDSSRGTNNFNSIDFETLLPSDVEECPHGELGPLLLYACSQPSLAANHQLLPCPLVCLCTASTGNVEGEWLQQQQTACSRHQAAMRPALNRQPPASATAAQQRRTRLLLWTLIHVSFFSCRSDAQRGHCADSQDQPDTARHYPHAEQGLGPAGGGCKRQGYWCDQPQGQSCH